MVRKASPVGRETRYSPDPAVADDHPRRYRTLYWSAAIRVAFTCWMVVVVIVGGVVVAPIVMEDWMAVVVVKVEEGPV